MTAPHNLALELMLIGDAEGALENALIALEVAPEQALTYNKVIFAYMMFERTDEAKAVGRRALERGLDTEFVRTALAWTALKEGDEASWEEHRATQQGRWVEAVILSARAGHEARLGRFEEAQDLVDRSLVIRERFGQQGGGARTLGRHAAAEALVGNSDGAIESAHDALALSRAPDVLFFSAQALAIAGETVEAEELLAELDAVANVESTRVRAVQIPGIEAILALQDGRPEDAVEVLESSRPWEGGWGQANSYVRGQALLAAGQGAEAEKEMRRLVEMPDLSFWNSPGQLGLLGLARAQVEQGKIDEARASYEAFFDAYRDADEGLPIVEKARSEYEALPGARG